MTIGPPFQKATLSKTEIRSSYDATLAAFERQYKSASDDALVVLRDNMTAKGQALLDSGLFPDDIMDEVREEMGFAASMVVALTAHHQICALQEQAEGTDAPEKIGVLEQQMEAIRVAAEAQLNKIAPPCIR